MMHAYASRPGSVTNRNALIKAGWRVLVSPYTAWARGRGENSVSFEEQCKQGNIDGFSHCAADNGAWPERPWEGPDDPRDRSNIPSWEPARFRKFMRAIGPIADWGVAPDIVYGGMASLEKSVEWLDECLEHYKVVLIAVQNGMTVEDLRPFVNARVGIFVGGDTTWKEQTVNQWADLCWENRTWCHVGRVNTTRRISIAECAGATSFDGTSVTRYSKNIKKLDQSRRQETLLRFR